MTKEEFAKSLNCNVEDLDLILLAYKGDYESVYYDYVSFEKSYEDEEINAEILTFKQVVLVDGSVVTISNKLLNGTITFNEFMNEFKKGYGNSEVLQIARLVELDDGIYYDNEFCF